MTPRVLIVSADRTMPSGLPLNLGDALLTHALAERVRDAGFDVRIADFGGVARASGDGTHLPLRGVAALWRALGRVDAVVIGGGTLLQDDSRTGPPWRGLPRLVLTTAVLARLRRTRVAFFGVGSNPTSRAIPRMMLRAALMMGRVWVRDDYSAALVSEQFRTRARVAADTALFWRPTAPPHSDDEVLVIAGYAGDLTMIDRAVLEELRRRFREIVFVSMHQGRPNDSAGLLTDASALVDRTYTDLTVADATALFSSASAILSSRMHALYFGAILGKPLLAFSRRPKIRAFAAEYAVSRVDDPSAAAEDATRSFAPASGRALAAARKRIDDAFTELETYLRPTKRSAP